MEHQVQLLKTELSKLTRLTLVNLAGLLEISGVIANSTKPRIIEAFCSSENREVVWEFFDLPNNPTSTLTFNSVREGVNVDAGMGQQGDAGQGAGTDSDSDAVDDSSSDESDHDGQNELNWSNMLNRTYEEEGKMRKRIIKNLPNQPECHKRAAVLEQEVANLSKADKKLEKLLASMEGYVRENTLASQYAFKMAYSNPLGLSDRAIQDHIEAAVFMNGSLIRKIKRQRRELVVGIKLDGLGPQERLFDDELRTNLENIKKEKEFIEKFNRPKVITTTTVRFFVRPLVQREDSTRTTRGEDFNRESHSTLHPFQPNRISNHNNPRATSKSGGKITTILEDMARARPRVGSIDDERWSQDRLHRFTTKTKLPLLSATYHPRRYSFGKRRDHQSSEEGCDTRGIITRRNQFFNAFPAIHDSQEEFHTKKAYNQFERDKQIDQSTSLQDGGYPQSSTPAQERVLHDQSRHQRCLSAYPSVLTSPEVYGFYLGESILRFQDTPLWLCPSSVDFHQDHEDGVRSIESRRFKEYYLSRRFTNHGDRQGGLYQMDKQSDQSPLQPWFSGKYGEINISPYSIIGIPRSYCQFTYLFAFDIEIKKESLEEKDCTTLQNRQGNTKEDGINHWFNRLTGSSNSSNKDTPFLSFPMHNVKPERKWKQLGSPIPNSRNHIGRSSLVDHQHKETPRDLVGSQGTRRQDYGRRLQDRMGSSDKWKDGTRSVEPGRESFIKQLERIDGSHKRYQSLVTRESKDNRTYHPYRRGQHHCSKLSSEERRESGRFEQSDQSFGKHLTREVINHHDSHQRCRQQNGGSSFQAIPRDPSPRSVQLFELQPRSFVHRFILQQSQPSSRSVPYSLPRRAFSRLEIPGGSLRPSSSSFNSTSPPKGKKGKSHNSLGRSVLGNSNVVSIGRRNENIPVANSSNKTIHRRRIIPKKKPFVVTSRDKDIRESLLGQNIPEEIINQIMINKWASSSAKSLQTNWKKWALFCETKGGNRLQYDQRLVLDCLSQEFKKGLKPSSVKYLWDAIRSTLRAINVDTSDHQVIESWLTAIAKNSSKAKYDSVFDTKILTNHIKTHMPDNQSLPIENLRAKTIVLLKLVLLGRSSDIQRLLWPNPLDIMGLSVFLFIDGPKGDPGKKIRVNIKSNPDMDICPVSCLKTYIDRATTLGTKGKYIFNYQNSENVVTPLSSQRIANITLGVMKDAGIDTSVYKSHSIRHAVATALIEGGKCPRVFNPVLETILLTPNNMT